MLILAEKVAEHVEGISHVRRVHFSTRQIHGHNHATTNSKFEPSVL
jgi:hypothetical protein